MKKQTIISLALCLSSIVSKGAFGGSDDPNLKKDKGRTTISFGTQIPVIGPNRAWMKHFTEHNFDSERQSIDWYGNEDISFPNSENRMGRNINLDVAVGERNSIRFNLSRMNNSIIRGHAYDEDWGYPSAFYWLEIRNVMDAYGMSYSLNSKNSTHQLRIGSSVIVHRIFEYRSMGDDKLLKKNYVPAFNLGYVFKIINTQEFFLAVNTDLFLAGNSEIPTIRVFEESFYRYGSPKRRLLNETKIGLSSLTVGVSCGINLSRN